MNIAINGLIIDQEKTGIGQYGYNLLNSILRNGSKYNYTIYLQNGIELNYGSIVYRNQYRKRAKRILDEQIVMPYKFRKNDLAHFLDYSSPIIGIQNPFIITIHDLCFYKYPETFTYGSRKLKSIITPISVKNANKIIAVSENTKRDLIEYFPNAENKIEVIYPGPPEVEKIFSKSQIDKVKSNYGIVGDYILSVGTLEPRKNLKRLIQAFKAINGVFNDIKLVIVGKSGWLYDDIFKNINNDKLRENIIITGYVEQKDISALYSGAEVFVYPSLYEGFGLPPLEAMCCGTPVVVSNTSSLPEVVGNAGVYVEPFSIDSIAEGIIKVIRDKELRNELVQRGYKQANKFSWDKAAAAVVNIYREILE